MSANKVFSEQEEQEITKIFQKHYNQAIDHAIVIVIKHRVELAYGASNNDQYDFSNKQLTSILDELQSLKQ